MNELLNWFKGVFGKYVALEYGIDSNWEYEKRKKELRRDRKMYKKLKELIELEDWKNNGNKN